LRAGKAPFIAFKVYHDRIVVDCNEDGFNERNLKAICSIGKSTKTGSQAYIGEKGIGFKSVFMAAWKVHVQSGSFSFSFIHRMNDSGMGMVNPLWEEPVATLPRPLTRITLFLHEYQDPTELTRHRELIRRQFRELDAPLLLFLRNIRNISIFFYDENEVEEWAVKFVQKTDSIANREILETSDPLASLGALPKKRVYHVTRYKATNLAKSENRALTAAEEARKSYATSEIVLAFPLTADSKPIIEPQKVFAFLPMRYVGFNVCAITPSFLCRT